MTPVYVIPQWFGNTLFLLTFLVVAFAVFVVLAGLKSLEDEIAELRAWLERLDPPAPIPPPPRPPPREHDSTDAYLDRLRIYEPPPKE